MSKKVNLTIATDIKGKGGISTVLTVYNKFGFFDDNAVKFIATHTNNVIFGNVGAFIFYAFALIRMSCYFVFFKVGLVHIHLASRGSYLRKSFIVRLAKFFKAKVIVHLHGAEFRQFYSNECDEAKRKHIRKTFDMADVVVVLSTQWHAWITTLMKDPSRVHIVYNAVPKLSLSRDNVESGNVLFLGRLGKRKGVDDLINAFVLVRETVPHAKLLLGGDGDITYYKSLVEQLGLQKSVEFLGWVSGDQKLDYLSKADIYTLPSYNEGFPMGVLEAMSAHIPIVASKAGGIPDAITSGKEGVLIDAGDVPALAEALVGLLTDVEKKKHYADAAIAKYNSSFSPDVIFPQLSNIYTDLLK